MVCLPHMKTRRHLQRHVPIFDPDFQQTSAVGPTKISVCLKVRPGSNPQHHLKLIWI